jgi:hypothetical protein
MIRDYEPKNKEPILRSALELARALGVSVEGLAKGVEDNEAAAPARKATVKPTRRTKGS